MNHLQLADEAIAESKKLLPIVSKNTAEQVALAIIAKWITVQDESIPSDNVLRTARLAIRDVQHWYETV